MRIYDSAMINSKTTRAIVIAALIAGLTPPIAAWAKSQPPAAPKETPPLLQKPASPDDRPERTPAVPSATVPLPRAEKWWVDRHNMILRLKTVAPVDMIFVGDSITQDWDQTGANVWDKHFARRRALNLGFSGDRTQHVLWRVRHNEVEGYDPKLAVVMIGTNNSNGDDYTAEQIADGIKAVVALLREKQPRMKILLLAIFPRGEQPNPQREKNAKASELASAIADGQFVHYMDIGSKFMNEEGVISQDIMPDYLHLSAKGYQVWADAIEDKVKELMAEGDNVQR